MVKIQCTLFNTTGQYRPVSTVIEVYSVAVFKACYKDYKKKAITKICLQRGWTQRELDMYNYNEFKARVYNS